MRESADEELMLAYQQGDHQAFERLYRRHKDALFRYLMRQTRDPASAEEIFQETWMNVIRARERYTVQAKFTTYLFHLAHNRLIDYYRKSSSGLPLSYREEIEADCLAGTHTPETELQGEQLQQRLNQAIAALPESQREAFLLREETGLSLEQIAQITGVSMETAKSRVRYALARLHKTLGDW